MVNKKASGMLNRAAFRLAGWQAAITGLVAAGAAGWGGESAAASAVTGGGIGIVAGLYQALRMFRADASRSPDGFMRGLYVGEAMKIALTVALFIAAIRVLKVEFAPTIIAYAATYVVYWAALSTGYPWLTVSSARTSAADRGST
jgi:ATP synthase protein I